MTFKENPDAWQTKVQVHFKLPFPIPWVIVASLIFGIGYTIFYYFDNKQIAIRLLTIESIIIAALANAVIYFFVILIISIIQIKFLQKREINL